MPERQATVTPWAGAKSADEEAIRRILARQGLQPYRWANGPHDVYSAHAHPYDKVIYVVRGSIVFGLPDTGRELALSAGDRLDLPRGITHNAVVGPQGVVCLEAHH